MSIAARSAWGAVILGALLVGTSGCGGAAPSGAARASSATTVPSAAPTPTAAVATLNVADIDRRLQAGAYQVGIPFGVPFTITLPAGWKLGSLVPGDVSFSGPPDGDSPWLVIDRIENVFVDPCDSAGGPKDPPVAPTVHAIVAAIAGMVGFDAGPVSDITVGTHAAKAFDLTNAIDTETAGCYGVQMLPLWTYAGGGEAATNGGARERIWVVDVDGTPVIVDRGGRGVDEVAASLEFGTPVSITPAATPVGTPSEPHLTYVALGDSLLFALEEDCDGCTSATEIYGRQIQAKLGIPVDVHNLTMHNGLSSSGLLRYLEEGAEVGRHPEDIFEAVAEADIVSVTIGFNDYSSPPANPKPLMPRFEATLDAILSRIDALRAGQLTMVRVTQIYNNGGPSWTGLVEAQNTVICNVAAAHDAICVDIYHPFNGPGGTGSPAALGYLGADGTHPSQRGMEVIADALTAVGFAPLE